jgi:hypothetical protein
MLGSDIFAWREGSPLPNKKALGLTERLSFAIQFCSSWIRAFCAG